MYFHILFLKAFSVGTPYNRWPSVEDSHVLVLNNTFGLKRENMDISLHLLPCDIKGKLWILRPIYKTCRKTCYSGSLPVT